MTNADVRRARPIHFIRVPTDVTHRDAAVLFGTHLRVPLSHPTVTSPHNDWGSVAKTRPFAFREANLRKGRERVDLGAVVVVPDERDLPITAIQEVPSRALDAAQNVRLLCSSRTPILGNDVLQSWMERVRKLGVRSLWLGSSARDEDVFCSGLAGLGGEGVERLLVIKLNSYAEMNLADLLRFHCDSRSSVTEAQDAQGPLGIRLIDRSALHATREEQGFCRVPSEVPRTLYEFRGYAKRILSARQRRDLVTDALTGACAMRPTGTQIREQVWIEEGVKLATSVRIIGPAYIGARTTIRAGATIGPFASVERDCVVDYGTTVQRSTVLPCTYLGPGLLIGSALVDGGYMEHLEWRATADLQPAGLARRIHRRASRGLATSREKAATDVISREGSPPAWAFASSSTSQPWVRLQL